MPSYKFVTSHNTKGFWAGYARQTIDFQAALAELVDNAISGASPLPVGDGRQPAIIEISVQELADTNVRVAVADAGTGVDWTQLTGDPNIFDLGYSPASQGVMNEHGFGLKNALALMTSGFTTPFNFLTRPFGAAKVYGVDGPLAHEMAARDDVSETEWADGLELLKSVESGTKVVVVSTARYFATVYNRAVNFDNRVQRLAEHLGVMYCNFIKAGTCQITVRYKSKDAPDWAVRKLQAIPTPFLLNSASKVDEREVVVSVDGTEYSAVYRTGLLDTSVKDEESRDRLGWPYPLRIHFQGSNARCGVSLRVRGRTLKTGVFKEIWPEKAGDVSFNNFLGELEVGAEFRTTNNKTDLDTHSALVEELFRALRQEEYQPEKNTKAASEESLRKSVIKQLSNSHNLTGQDIPRHKKVWSDGAEIDVFFEVGGDARIFETKVTIGIVKDVYQLLMYWDGLVEEGLDPAEATLIADGFQPSVPKAIAHINQLRDKRNKPYNLRTSPLSTWRV